MGAKDYSKGNYRRHLYELGWPMVLSNYVLLLNTLIDMYIVAGVSELAITAVGMIGALSGVLRIVYRMPLYRLETRLAEVLGRGDREELRELTRKTTLMMLVFMVVLGVGTYMGADVVLWMIGISEGSNKGLYEVAKDYYKVYIPMYMVYKGMTMYYTAYFMRLGKTRVISVVKVLDVGINIGLTVVLTGVMGVVGTGLATVLAGLVSLMVMVVYNRVKIGEEVRLEVMRDIREWRGVEISKEDIKESFSVMINHILYKGVVLVFMRVLTLSSPSASGVYNVLLKLEGFILYIPVALGSSLATYVGYNRGAKEERNMMRGIRGGLVFAGLVGLVGFVLFWGYGREVLGVFYKGEVDEGFVGLVLVLMSVTGLVRSVSWTSYETVYTLGKGKIHSSVMTYLNMVVLGVLWLLGGRIRVEWLLCVYMSMYVIEGSIILVLMRGEYRKIRREVEEKERVCLE